MHLGNYVKSWNKQMDCFDDKPRHDEHEHASSSFRYGMQAILKGLVSNELGYGIDNVRQQILDRRSRVDV